MNFLKKIFSRNKISDYESPVDEFFAKFDQEHPRKSQSQQQEIKKFKRIFYLRDHPVAKEESNIWKGF